LPIASLCFVTACSSVEGDSVSADSNAVAAVTPTPTPAPAPTPTPAPTSTTSVVYDASIGAGVDANGFADLPLRSGAHRYFVSSATGSDTNSCSAAQSPLAPKRTAAAGAACAADGAGDQVLFAEGSTFAERIPSMAFKSGGYSLLYPQVFESYDPADAANEAKYGRASGAQRPVFTGSMTAGTPWIFGGNNQSFIAVRGLDINPGNMSQQSLDSVEVGSGILFENNVFRYTEVVLTVSSKPIAHNWIFRNNAIYGNWSADMTYHTQGIYAAGCDSLTIEDNVLWHNGWKIGGAGRDSATDGATMFRHAIYQQVNTNSTIRRNLIVDGSADGGSHRGDAAVTENVYIDNPIAIAAGGGVSYNTARPNGDVLLVAYNAVLGSAQINSTGAAGWGIDTENGTSASEAHHNLLVRSGSTNHAFSVGADFDQPSYMNFHDNVSYQWSASGNSALSYGPFSAKALPTYNNNIWDNPASGTNTNISSHTFPNPYTAAQLYAALGFTDKQSFMNYAVSNPETHPARNARALLFAGYGM
jgi:hypothetical protein